MTLGAASTFLCALVVLFGPGYLASRLLGLPRALAFGAAPATSIFVYTLLGTLFACVDLLGSPATLVFIPSFCLVTALFVRLRHGIQAPRDALPLGIVAAYVIVALAALWVVYVGRVPLETLLMEYYDNVFHYNNVRAIADSGIYSLHVPRLYATSADLQIAPWPVSSDFYPFGWHFVCALVLQVTGESMALVTNVVNYVIAGAAFPAGMALLNECLVPGSRHARIAGILTSTALTGFPWMLQVLWPLFPNAFGLALVPATVGLFISLAQAEPSQRAPLTFALSLSLAGIAAAHPNALFTLAILLFPFVLSRALASQETHVWGHTFSRRTLVVLACVIFVVGWLALFVHPALRGVVTFTWETGVSVPDAVWSVLSLGYLHGLGTDVPQHLMAALVLLGVVHAVRTGRNRWVVGSYALSCLILFASLVLPSTSLLRHLLAGLWYTDPYRIAAMTTICALPLATNGLSLLLQLLDEALERRSVQSTNVRRWRAFGTGIVCAAFLAIIYLPQLPILTEHDIWTPFGAYRTIANLAVLRDDVLNRQEVAFLQRAQELIPQDAVIINYPFDGSNFAYGATGTRVLYRAIGGYDDGSQTERSSLLRERLNLVARDTAVQEAIRSLGDCYVLRLAQNEGLSLDGWGNYLGEPYQTSTWAGIRSIDDETPGFSIVLAEGDLRLYHVDY